MVTVVEVEVKSYLANILRMYIKIENFSCTDMHVSMIGLYFVVGSATTQNLPFVFSELNFS
jgi:hypothetical protein